MSTPAAERAEPGPGTGEDGPAEPDERGALEIDRSVIRKLAAYVVDQHPGTTKVARTMRADRGASVRVGRGREALDLDLVVGLDYPIDVRATVSAVREQVTEEITRATGYRVRAIDVTVSALRAADAAPRVR